MRQPGTKVVYSVQVNDFLLTVTVVCPNCGDTLEIFDSPTHDQERLCGSVGCEDLRFKIAATVQVFTGIKPEESKNKQDHGTCWKCDGKGILISSEGATAECHNCKGTGRNP
jgi:ribosomal protein S27E